ncbi:PH domain-containing protein [Canibacter zhoujuaniae]|uniref:PH domain-containing protein n=1 Tax=Canibacter zhoujuaniae TaxID=2708343 RepID=UPI00141E0025|nr:PH domain-containing protein [Canibacter zhoujuaniae]
MDAVPEDPEIRAFKTTGSAVKPLGPKDDWPYERGVWNRLDARYAWVDLVGNLIPVLLFALVFVLPIIDAEHGLGGFFEWIPAWARYMALVIAGLFLCNAALAFRRVRTMGWVMRQDDFVFRRGLLFQRTSAVPYGRLQLVDISQGPLQRKLGLASLKFLTAAASGTQVLPGLSAEDADRLRDELISVAESRRSGV